jgi:hypothetical protein
MKQETLEEAFLANIKNVLQFGNDAQAERFMEKYYQAKKEQKQHIIDIMKSDEELGLYEETECDCGVELDCKDCSQSLQVCTCIEDTINMKKGTMSEAIKQVITDKLKQETLVEAALNYSTDMLGTIYEELEKAFVKGAKWQQEQNDTSKVNRVEVIQHSEPFNGRAYTNYNAKDVEIQFQDNGKTLKIFLK